MFLLLYSALLGFPAPVVRASLLLLIFLLRRILRRAPDPLTALCAAFFAILLLRPLDLFSSSFQLSFCAVLGMVLFAPALERKLQRVQPRFLREGWVNTFSATTGTVLPAVQLFHQFSLAGLLLNPFLCAFFAVLLPLYALTLLIGCVYLPAGAGLAGWLPPP
jgi:competence protein ComEC